MLLWMHALVAACLAAWLCDDHHGRLNSMIINEDFLVDKTVLLDI